MDREGAGIEDRLRETTCLLAVIAAVRRHDLPLAAVVETLIELIPSGLPPEPPVMIRVTLADCCRETAGFHTTPWVVQAPVAGGGLLALAFRRQPDARGVACTALLAAIADHLNAALLERERRLEHALLSQVVARCPHAVLVADLEGRIERANLAAGALLGEAPDALAGRTVPWLDGDELPADAPAQIAAAVRAGSEWRTGISGWRADGSAYDAVMTLAALHTPEGEPCRLLVTAEETTERLRLAACEDELLRQERFARLAGGAARAVTVAAASLEASLGAVDAAATELRCRQQEQAWLLRQAAAGDLTPEARDAIHALFARADQDRPGGETPAALEQSRDLVASIARTATILQTLDPDGPGEPIAAHLGAAIQAAVAAARDRSGVAA